MQFLCLGYVNEAAFETMSQEEQDALMKKCFEQCVPFRATGKVVVEEGLRGSSTAKSIRPRGGKPTVTDGPFIDTKESVGAFWVIEADSIEEAIAITSLHPAALMGEEFGFGIEVRPVRS